MKLLKLTLASLLVGASSLSAADFDFSGTFRQDNDIAQFNFTVGVDSTVTVFSSSWDDGGFDPILAIWTGGGSLMAQQDDGGNTGSTMSNAVSYTHGTWDSYYTVFLTAGNYIATVAQYNNFSVSANLADGFQQDGNPNFTFDQNYGGATQPLFNGVWDNNDPRTGNYVFHILNVAEATHQPPGVPDHASTLGLLGLAFVGVASLRRRLA